MAKSAGKKSQKSFEQRAIAIVSSPWRLFRALCFSIGLLVMSLGLLLGLYLHFFLSSIPDLAQLDFSSLKSLGQKQVRKKLDGAKIKHQWVPIENMSRDLIYATVMAEDAHYFEHDGVNYDAILRALAQNYKSKAFVSGASTITQQVTKNLFFTSDKSLKRKAQEFILARRMNQHFKKNEVMEVYLNVAEFGPDLFGVAAASHYYFRKKPEKITADEAAFMALMLPSPRKSHYSIFVKHILTERRVRKMKRIWQSMLAEEFISHQEYNRYLKRKDYWKYAPQSRGLGGE